MLFFRQVISVRRFPTPFGWPLFAVAVCLTIHSSLFGQSTLRQSESVQQPSNSTNVTETSTESRSLQSERGSSESAFDDLIAVQQQIRNIVPKVQPCVVAVEGGTGVIVSSDGIVLTASHVAGRAGRKIVVKLANGREVEGTTLGTNNRTDASAIKLNSVGPWPFLEIDSTTKLTPGTWCLSFGYPSGFPRVASAALRLGRILKLEDHEIMTDCPIMGGDSGGPLISLDGKLIGINSRVKMGIHENFHIPASVFTDQWASIAGSSDIRDRVSPTGQRAYLGLHAETDSDRVRIRYVHANSPAEAAGLKPEDVILEFDGKRIVSFDEVLRSIEGRQRGEAVSLIVNRYGQLLRIWVSLGSQY